MKTISVIPRGRQRHTQNMQVNKVIDENEEYAFHFTEKNPCLSKQMQI